MPLGKIRKIRLSVYYRKWSALARKQRPACEYCGTSQNLQAHHFKGRSCKATRLMLDNAVVLCSSHHVFNRQFSAHLTPEAFTRWFKKAHPDRYRSVIKKAQTMISEREAIQEFLTAVTIVRF